MGCKFDKQSAPSFTKMKYSHKLEKFYFLNCETFLLDSGEVKGLTKDVFEEVRIP